MRHIGVLLLTLFVSQAASANVDVNCFLGDCMTQGWQAYETTTGQSQVVECNNLDCLFEGWVTLQNGREINYSVCKPEGCFEDGWVVYDSNTNRVLSDVTCGRGFAGARCFDLGWNTFIPGRGTYTTRCRNSDCTQFGWIVQIPGFANQTAQCKAGGCFSSGWVLYR